MNNGMAKMLRKEAESQNIGSKREYQHHMKSVFIREGTRYCSTKELKNCTRKVYKKLKQQYKGQE